MSKPVAVDGDTQAKTSQKKHPADTNSTGQWSLTQSSVTKGSKVSVNAKLVELGATASWTYAGGTVPGPSGSVAVGPFSDSATLNASPTDLKDEGRSILVDGDQATGSVDSDNKIVATASQSKLRTD